jgi:hypothetical protein
MRPSPKLRRIAEALDPAGAKSKPAARDAPLVRALVGRRDATERALRGLDEIRGKADAALDAELKRIAEGVTAAPKPLADAVVVRAFGLVKGGEKRPRPLPGVRLRLTMAEKPVAEEETDIYGVAVLSLPDGAEGRAGIVVEALDAKGEVVAKRRAEGEPARGVVVVLELAESDGLAASFALGEAWLKAQVVAAEKAKELRELVAAASPRLREALEVSLRQLDEAIEMAAKGEGGEDGGAEGQECVEDGDRADEARRPKERSDPRRRRGGAG